ncbi:MAG TPA: glycoside hydrolase family 127 protein, partial [Armatimonadota bacterium]|nr:glycoside hydrolase family 127 protein [Armatimonadota bacterium]
MYVTGAIGAYHHGVSSRHDMVHEAFGREYELPNRTAYNETCSNVGNAMWNMRLLALTGEARYGDVMERVLYNSALSPMDIDGTRFCYTNPLARRVGASMLSHDTLQRWSEFNCYCCPPQVARTLAKVHEWAYGTSPDGVWVHLYGGSVLETDVAGKGAIRLVQETDYPWDGAVRLTVEDAPGGDFAMMLRIPEWAEGASVRMNGETITPAPDPGSYYRIEREWTAGDVVELSLPMRARLLQAHPEVEETQNQVAIMRGPVVYCLEGVDLPEGVRVEDVHVPRDIQPDATHVPELLGGVTVLEGEAVLRPAAEWDGKLYQEIPAAQDEPVRIRLIPYYAWLNRGECDMRVWLPLA